MTTAAQDSEKFCVPEEAKEMAERYEMSRFLALALGKADFRKGLQPFQDFFDVWHIPTAHRAKPLMVECWGDFLSWPDTGEVLGDLSSDIVLEADRKFKGPSHTYRYDFCCFLMSQDSRFPRWQRDALTKIRERLPVLITVSVEEFGKREFGDIRDYCDMYIKETEGKQVVMTDASSFVEGCYELLGIRALRKAGWMASRPVCYNATKVISRLVSGLAVCDMLRTTEDLHAQCLFVWLQRAIWCVMFTWATPWAFVSGQEELINWLTESVENERITALLTGLASEFCEKMKASLKSKSQEVLSRCLDSQPSENTARSQIQAESTRRIVLGVAQAVSRCFRRLFGADDTIASQITGSEMIDDIEHELTSASKRLLRDD